MIQPFKMVRGATEHMKITIREKGGSVYLLTPEEVLRFGVTKHPGDDGYIIKKEMTAENESDGSYYFDIMPQDTLSLAFGKYYYDVGVQSGDNYYPVIRCSEFIVADNVTRWEAG